MRTVRLYVDQPLAAGKRLTLADDRSRYLTQSLRLSTGARIQLFNETDGAFTAQIESPRKRGTIVVLGERIASDTESALRVTLAQAIGKGDRMDYAIQKATELGVWRIQPLLSERTEVKLTAERAEKRRARWILVARAAAEQCGRTKPPHVAAPCAPDTWINTLDAEGERFFLDPESRQALHVETSASSVVVAIGPEGGWSERDRASFAAGGFKSARVGPRILRTETAAATAVALIQAQAGDLLQ